MKLANLSTAASFARGAALSVAAAVLQWIVHPLVGSHASFVFFLPTLAFAATSLGRGPAILVLLLGAVNAVLMAEPVGHFVIQNSQDAAAVLIYLALGAAVVLYGGHLRLTTRRAALAERRLALAQDETGVGVFDLDFQAGTAYVSPSMSKILRQPVTLEPIGLDRWLGALRPEHVVETRQAIQQRLANGELRYEREQRITLPDGEVVWVLNRVQLEATAAGELTHARGAAVDVTERKKAADLLAAAVAERERARDRAAQTEQRFLVALESSVVPFSMLAPVRDRGGKITDFEWTYLNPAATHAIGREPDTLLGRPITEVLPRAWDSPGEFDHYVRCVERGEPCQFEICTDAANRGTRWYSVVASPLQGSIAVWFANITERKHREQALEDADRRKDEFLATLAHELRNPLAAIRQGLSIARAADSTDLQKRRGHAVIERQVQHLSLLIDDLLDVARVGRGTLLLRKSKETLSGVLETAIEMARPHIEAKRHQLSVELPQTQVMLEIDPLRFAQVLANLLINAAKFTDVGGRIVLAAHRDTAGLAIRIKDNGIGLTPEQKQQVFDMFSQIPAAVERSQGGLGIGLALARGLIGLHDGTIDVSSAGPGHGAEFTVRLPESGIAGTHEPVQVVPAIAVAPPSERGSISRILIADDNRDAADTLAELLRLDGYEVYVVYDGEDALSTFMQLTPHAALLDVGMPRLSGIEVVRAIREHPSGLHAILIAVTGWAEEKDRRAALEAGFDHHITKPMDPASIQALIDRGRKGRAAPVV